MERCQSPAEWDSLENYYTCKGIASSNLALSVDLMINDDAAKLKEGFVGISCLKARGRKPTESSGF